MISSRIQELQKLSALRGKNPKTAHFDYDYHYAAINEFPNLPHSLKLAKSMAYAIGNQDVWAYKEDGLGGRIYYDKEKEVITRDPNLDYITSAYKQFKEKVVDYDELIDNQLILNVTDGKGLWCNGHITWLYEKILSLGVTGLKQKFLEALENPKDQQAKEFYEGVVILLDSLLEFNDKHIAEYEKLGNMELADRMKKVPRYACESFKEAVQAYFMQHIVVMRENPFGGNSPGRLDYYLWPYLEKDLANNTITLEEAKEIICELFLRMDERLYNMDVWGEMIVVGGTDEEGNSAVNPLSYIMVEAIMDLNIIHPSVYIRMPANPPKEFMELAAKYIKDGSNRAQIFSDEAIINALTLSGIDYKEATNYASGGCMEIGIQGKHCDFLYCGWQNTAKMLELLVTGGISLKDNKKLKTFKYTKSIVGYDDFEEFYNDYLKVLKEYVHLSFYEMDLFNELAERNRPSYLMSSMIDDCLERGRNLNAGGAKYHDYGTTPMALPDTIDSLYAIKYAIFDHKLCSKEELLTALKINFDGYEKLNYTLTNIPKYGMDEDEINQFASRLISDMCDIHHSYKTRHGGHGKPVILTFIHAAAAKGILGARPSGKKAFTSIAHGVTPNSASMTEGITAAINSCCSIPFNKISGGASTMWDLDPDWANEVIIESLIKTFINKKGQIFQGNATSVAELIAATKNPEEYQHLIVRVGGYSARFINLNPSVQEDVINRFRHKG